MYRIITSSVMEKTNAQTMTDNGIGANTHESEAEQCSLVVAVSDHFFLFLERKASKKVHQEPQNLQNKSLKDLQHHHFCISDKHSSVSMIRPLRNKIYTPL